MPELLLFVFESLLYFKTVLGLFKHVVPVRAYLGLRTHIPCHSARRVPHLRVVSRLNHQWLELDERLVRVFVERCFQASRDLIYAGFERLDFDLV